MQIDLQLILIKKFNMPFVDLIQTFLQPKRIHPFYRAFYQSNAEFLVRRWRGIL